MSTNFTSTTPLPSLAADYEPTTAPTPAPSVLPEEEPTIPYVLDGASVAEEPVPIEQSSVRIDNSRFYVAGALALCATLLLVGCFFCKRRRRRTGGVAYSKLSQHNPFVELNRRCVFIPYLLGFFIAIAGGLHKAKHSKTTTGWTTSMESFVDSRTPRTLIVSL